MDDESGSMSSHSLYNIKSEIEIARKMAQTSSLPVIVDVQHDFIWPTHSHSMASKLGSDDPLDQACDLLNRMEAAQALAIASQRDLKRHLIEHDISRKKVREKIAERNKLFKKLSFETDSFFFPKLDGSNSRTFFPGGTA